MRDGVVEIRERLEGVERRIEEALIGALRNRNNLTMVAVTKRQPLRRVLQAYEVGIRQFGESQIQESVPKIKAAPKDIHWHFVGHLQKNKVRSCVKHFPFIHSIDSVALLRRVNQIAGEERFKPAVFLQVNLVHDPDKYGLHPDTVETVLEEALECQHLECVGLMAIPPVNYGEEEIVEYFSQIRELRDQLRLRFPDWLGVLSMGMTNDFHLAIRCGSNYLRIGTALFGEREK